MDRLARLRVLETGQGPGIELWLIACALVGLACSWIVRIDAPERVWSADLAVGRGLPLLADQLGTAHDWRLLKDAADPMALVATGAVPVAVDASAAGVRILYRAEVATETRLLIGTLADRWPEAQVDILRQPTDSARLLSLLVALLALNAAALVAAARLQRLQDGAWWRWLAMQGALSPELLLGLLTRPVLGAAALGGMGLLAGFGLPALTDLGLPMLLLAAAGAGLGLLTHVTRGLTKLLLWAMPQLLLLRLIYGPAIVEDLPMRGIWWGAAASVVILMVLAAVALRHRLKCWRQGALPA